jgi:hypothetical protein
MHLTNVLCCSDPDTATDDCCDIAYAQCNGVTLCWGDASEVSADCKDEDWWQDDDFKCDCHYVMAADASKGYDDHLDENELAANDKCWEEHG